MNDTFPIQPIDQLVNQSVSQSVSHSINQSAQQMNFSTYRTIRTGNNLFEARIIFAAMDRFFVGNDHFRFLVISKRDKENENYYCNESITAVFNEIGHSSKPPSLMMKVRRITPTLRVN